MMRKIGISRLMSCVLLYTTLVFALGCTQSKDNDQINQHSAESTDVNPYGVPHPDAPIETTQLAGLIGAWHCISEDLVKASIDSAIWITNKASWRWEYILGGHALLNNWWQEDNSPNPISKEYFVSGIFIFNPKTKAWEAAIMNSRPHRISPKFQLQYHNGEIKMNDGSGKWQVTFFDIQKNSFEWKYEILENNGSWKSISKIHARRAL